MPQPNACKYKSELKVVIIHANGNESAADALQITLYTVQRKYQLSVWSPSSIHPGFNREQVTQQQLADADLIIPLLCPYFLASDWNEICRQLLEEAKKWFAPIQLKTCFLDNTIWQNRQLLPKNGKAIPVLQRNCPEGYEEIPLAIQRLVIHIRKQSTNLSQQTVPKPVQTQQVTDMGPYRMPDPFVDVDERIKQIQEQFQHKSIIHLRGIGGAGKTTLAKAYYVAPPSFYHKKSWITLSRKQTLMEAVCQQCSQYIDQQKLNHLSKKEDLFKRIMLGWKNMSTTPNLLVIDNITNINQINRWYNYLNLPNWHIILTSRLKIAYFSQQLQPIYLSSLRAKYSHPIGLRQALSLFKAYLHQSIEDEVLLPLIKAVDRHPLSIAMLANYYNRSPKFWCPNKILAQVKNEQLITALTSANRQLNLYNDPFYSDDEEYNNKLKSFLSDIFDYSYLSKITLWCLHQLCLLPNRSYTFEELLNSLNIVPYTEKAEWFEEQLFQLIDQGWLIKSTAYTFKVPYLIRELANPLD